MREADVFALKRHGGDVIVAPVGATKDARDGPRALHRLPQKKKAKAARDGPPAATQANPADKAKAPG